MDGVGSLRLITHHRNWLSLPPPPFPRGSCNYSTNCQLFKTTGADMVVAVPGIQPSAPAASVKLEYYHHTRRFCRPHSHGFSIPPAPTAPARTLLPLPPRASLVETLSSSLLVPEPPHHPHSSLPIALLVFLADTDTVPAYSQASYYTSLGLFLISVPGLWSLIKRSVKSKIVQKTFIAMSDGDGNVMPNQVAGAILSFFTRNNFVVLERGDTITFEGMMVPSRNQAALLTFCTCISLASVALVLTITVPQGGNNWFWLTALSPLAGAYYWTKASRKEQIKVKMIVADNGSLSEIIVQGDDQEVDRMRRELQLTEKGMIYVKGVFER